MTSLKSQLIQLCGNVSSPGRQSGTPYVDIRSEQGVLGLTLLQKVLLDQEAQQAQGTACNSDISPAATVTMQMQ